jgi:hypothetical protein
MIIRKPYAFLVKYFKIIHFVLLVPLIYIALRSFKLMQFFNNFVSNGYVVKETEVITNYYHFLIPLACLFVIIVVSLIYALLKNKNLSASAYLWIIIFYAIFFIISLSLPSILNTFSTTDIPSSTALLYKGLATIIFYLQPLFIIILLFKGLGFDLKNFEFTNIKDLINLDESDNEEVELNVGFENYELKRGFRRYFRELKYYIIENKAVLKTLGFILVGILTIFLVRWIISLNRIVRIDQSFTLSKLSLTFNDSILSAYDYNGNVIKDGNIYLAVKTTVKNNTKGFVTLKTDDLWLEMGDKYYYPVLDRSGKFLDLAKPYYGDQIGAGDSNEYVLVYELSSSELYTNYKIKILDSITYKENQIIPLYKELTLTPRYLNEIKDNGDFALGSTINFSNTTMLNTTMTINSYELTNSYVYSYDYCYNDKCTKSLNSVTPAYNSMLLVLDGNIVLDENASYTKYKLGSNDFAQDFIKVYYEIGDKNATVTVKNVTPKTVTDKIVLEVNRAIAYADHIKLAITIRNQKYNLVLK